MQKLEIKYRVKGEEKDSLFKDYCAFERDVDVDELVRMLGDYKVIVHEATRMTKTIEVEDDWTVMK